MREITNTDMKIIKLLQKNARMSIVDIADEVSLSRTSVKNRIDQLVEEGYIGQFTIEVPPKIFGKNISFILKISNLKVSIKEFERLITQFTDLTEVDRITGSDNYFARGYFDNTDTMNILLEKLMKLGDVKTSIVLEKILDQGIQIQ